MLKQDRWLLPEGIEEVFPEESAHIEYLRRKVLDLFATWGYRLVIPPFIEFLDSLLVGTGYDLDLETFKLIDQISGRMMGIRADMTPQVARIDARTASGDRPARLCYLGTVLHTQSDHLEKTRAPMQVGAELYGHAGKASDIEIIRLMLEMLAVMGIAEVHLDLGHVGIYRGLAQQAGLDAGQEAELFAILQRKDRTELLEFLEAARVAAVAAERLLALLDLNGPHAVLADARRCLGEAGEFVASALADLDAVAACLNRLFPALPVNFDLAELRGYHYQTGVVFAAFVPGYGREIARGGRYNEIGKVFGRARPATGFSADLRVLARLAGTDGDVAEVPAIFAPAVDDPDLHETIRNLRAAGRTVVQELPGQTENAQEMGCQSELRKLGLEWKVVGVDPR
ncbi:ATP phosphoribosyltransferase regulatory subunit [Methylomagnum ishizawai]|uniref:ATP phosphoribosyltransferase regulatory subunit n=1 Tax=Methylomagnum ishizawai TaxID=1760988 RepID=UPI001C327F91|nr:ATP phosphoribosyltransferase regulatory subunit [Methylomagnum ishizawai]BBL76087.1 ATP phosphoribosyltransferase regulatory subunit [Methylomagnum ishizawai]